MLRDGISGLPENELWKGIVNAMNRRDTESQLLINSSFSQWLKGWFAEGKARERNSIECPKKKEDRQRGK